MPILYLPNIINYICVKFYTLSDLEIIYGGLSLKKFSSYIQITFYIRM